MGALPLVSLRAHILDWSDRRESAEASCRDDPCSRQIEAAHAGIDALVYELYGLTEDEVAIVEGRA